MEPKRILVVDDDPLILDLIRFNLEAEGYNVITASDGFDALERARKEFPDMLVLDLMLPKMDGYKVCRILKFDEKYKNIPILMLTARAQESDKEMGLETGADAYMTKPFEPDELLEKVSKLLGNKDQDQQKD